MIKKTEMVRFRATPLEKRLWEANAKAMNMPMSLWIRLMVGFAISRGGNSIGPSMKKKA
jgi:hypothetical protein